MTPAPDSEISVRGRARAIALVWLFRGVVAFAVSYPVARILAAEATAFPLGDAVLFETGGFHLLEVLRTGRQEIAASMQAAAVLGILAALAGLIPLAALMVALNYRPSSRKIVPWIARTLACLPRFTLLSGIIVLSQAIGLCIVALASVKISDALTATLSDQAADWIAAAALVIGTLGVAFLGIVEDLARASVVRCRRRALEAMKDAASLVVRLPLRVLAAWSLPAAISVGIIVVVAALVGALHVERDGAWRTFAVFLLHQGAVLALVVSRAVWLARALRFVAAEATDAVTTTNPSPRLRAPLVRAP